MAAGLPGGGVGEGGEVGEVVGVAGVLDGGGVVGEGAEVVGGDAAVQLLAAPADRLQGLGEHRLEGAELGVDVGVRVAAQGLRVVAAFGGVLVLVAVLVEAGAGAEQLLATPADGAEGLGEDDLEVGELGVDVVVGLGADLLGLLTGLGEDAVGLGLRAAGDLGVGDQRAPFGVGALDDPLGLLAGLRHHLLPVADQLLGLGEGAGQFGAQFLQQREQFGAVDHARGRHGHGAGAGDHRGDLVELLLHVHRVLATLYSCVGDGRDDCTTLGRPGDTG
ncbi:hypothetical protein IMX12_25560 [Streptomyces sp. Babs14]|nr:hypothetical protein [Streptomyces sp. Babs14]